ncbi:hypothetical protein ACFYSF_20515 [Streptomyces canus]|uniref:hypothetical protein n=1 Tax=Streptomyces canus TaxID=58343 RepID=UPI0036B99E7F
MARNVAEGTDTASGPVIGGTGTPTVRAGRAPSGLYPEPATRPSTPRCAEEQTALLVPSTGPNRPGVGLLGQGG